MHVCVSTYGLDGVIQHRVDGHKRPIVYASMLLTKAEENYSQREKERLAIILCLIKFRQ